MFQSSALFTLIICNLRCDLCITSPNLIGFLTFSLSRLQGSQSDYCNYDCSVSLLPLISNSIPPKVQKEARLKAIRRVIFFVKDSESIILIPYQRLLRDSTRGSSHTLLLLGKTYP